MIKNVFVIAVIILLSSCQSSKESNNQQNGNETEQTVEQVQTQATQQTAETEQTQNVSELAYLLELKGKYPYEYELFTNDPLKRRLQKILFGEYDAFVQRMEVQVPIEVNGNEVFMEGLMAHSGGSDEAAIIVDVEKNLIWVLIYKDGNDLKIFKDDRDVRMPQRFFNKVTEYK